MIDTVQAAIAAVGFHRLAPVSVTAAELDGIELHIEATLVLSAETPMCCGEPGCFTAFLGRRREDLPHALAARLELARPPRVSVRLSVSGTAVTYDFPPAHFTAAGA